MSEKITNEFLKYRRIIASLLSKIQPSASQRDIEDILQETFINTHRASLKQDIRFPRAFMVNTAIRLVNRCINSARDTKWSSDFEHHARENQLLYDASDFLSQSEKHVLNQDSFGVLCASVNELPEQCRKVFVLKKVYGLSQREIADKLSINERAVEKHVANGLLRSMQAYDQLQTEDQFDNLKSLKADDIQRSNK